MLEDWDQETSSRKDMRETIFPGILKGLWAVWNSALVSTYVVFFYAASVLAFFGALLAPNQH